MKRQSIHMYTVGYFEPTARVTRMVNNGNVYFFQRRVNCKLEKLAKIQEACPTRISTWQFSFFSPRIPSSRLIIRLVFLARFPLRTISKIARQPVRFWKIIGETIKSRELVLRICADYLRRYIIP